MLVNFTVVCKTCGTNASKICFHYLLLVETMELLDVSQSVR